MNKTQKLKLEKRLMQIYNRAARPHKHIGEDIYFLLAIIQVFSKLYDGKLFKMEWYDKN